MTDHSDYKPDDLDLTLQEVLDQFADGEPVKIVPGPWTILTDGEATTTSSWNVRSQGLIAEYDADTDEDLHYVEVAQ